MDKDDIGGQAVSDTLKFDDCSGGWQPPLSKEERIAHLERELAEWKARAGAMIAATISHVDGRDLLAELKPLHWHYCNIKVRINGEWREYEGDWLKRLYNARGQINAAQAAQNAAGQERNRRTGLKANPADAYAGLSADDRSRGGPHAAADQGANPHPAPAAPIADPQVPEVREAPGNRPIASSPASSALVSKEDVLAIIRGEKAAWNEPSNTAYTVCENIAESVRLLECAAPASGYELHVQFKTADLPKKQPSIIPDSGPSEAPCRHEWYQGTCAHCKIDADDYRASLRLAGRKP